MTQLTTTTARQLQGRALSAEAARDRAMETLHRPDGTKRYGDEEHAERQGAIAEAFREALDAVEEDAEREAAKAETGLAALENGDPTDLLTADELQRAAAKRGFVNEDVEALPAAELAGRLRAVLAGGDKASVFCYLRAAERRAGESRPAPDGVTEVLGEMRSELLGDSRRRDAERARRLAEEVREVKTLVWALKRGGRDVGAVYRRQAYGDLARRFGGGG